MHESQPPTRKVGITHMAFYRGWLQGLPLRDMADSYLETGLDLRVAKTTLAWVQDELRRATLRHGRHGESRLLRLRIADVHAVSAQPANLPSIDDFREDFDPTGFYSYDELMTHYLERYPQADNHRARKRAALLERQIRTLNWLEALVVTTPVHSDPIEAWLDDTFVGPLHAGGVATIGDLFKLMAVRGYRWYRVIPQFGEKRALRILAWFTAYASSLGELPAFAKLTHTEFKDALKNNPTLRRRPAVPLSLSGPVQGNVGDQAPLAASGFAMIPLEALLPPSAPLTGTIVSADIPRPDEIRSGSRIVATDDRAAIETWLNAQSRSDATLRAYRKEAGRLLLWVGYERRLTLRDMTVDDCIAYRDWLCWLGRTDDASWPYNVPQKEWFGKRNVSRESDAWRPFEGPLSQKSVLYALTVCRALSRWLAKMRYLHFDPWASVANPRAVAGDAPDTELTRVLSNEDWECLRDYVETIRDWAPRVRARMFIHLALVTGLRLAELTDATYDNLYSKPMRDGSGVRWMLKVLGKGGRWRAVPVTSDVLDYMRGTLRTRGIPDDPNSVPAGTKILYNLLDGKPLTISGTAKLAKSLFERAAKKLEARGLADDAKRLRRASTHWLRHTTGAFLGNSGAPPSQIQQLLGHTSIATTTIYTGTVEDELFKTVSNVLGSK